MNDIFFRTLDKLQQLVSEKIGDTDIDVKDYEDALMPTVNIEAIKDKSYHDPARCLLLCELVYDAKGIESQDEKTSIDELTQMLTTKDLSDEYEVVGVFRRAQYPTVVFKRNDVHYVITRGSTTAADFVTNLFVKMQDKFNSKIHSGFCQAYSEISEKLQKLIGESEHVIFSGHSAGGALSALHAANYYSSTVIEPALITFGAPRISNKNFQEFIFNYTKHIRFETLNDIVPTIPKPTIVMENLTEYHPWMATKHVFLSPFSKAKTSKENEKYIVQEPQKLDIVEIATGTATHLFDVYMKSFLRHVENRPFDCCIIV